MDPPRFDEHPSERVSRPTDSCEDQIMAITSHMAKMSIRSTFALDPGTVATLARLAEKWGVSKSAALRRIIEAAAVVEGVDSSADGMAALEELQERLALSSEQIDAWLREVRAIREDRSS